VRDVLVFTPYLHQVEPRTLEALTRLEWEGSLSLLLQRDNPYGEDRVRNHLHQYQQGRKAFLAGRHEAMLVIEADVLPPPDTLRRLDALDCDLAYGCVAFRSGPPYVANVLERYPGQARNIGESISLRPNLWDEALKVGTIECSGSGLACVLIRRHVLEALDFREVEDAFGVYCDLQWTREAFAAGYGMKADMGVMCGHIDDGGAVLWPEVVA